MAFAWWHGQRRWRPAASARLAPPVGEFALAALALGGGLVVLAALLTGGDPGATVAALLAFAAGAALAGHALARSYPHDRLGPCNAITLARLALASALLAPLAAGDAASWAVVAVALVALALDGVDGRLARRRGHVSEFGARFDMEVDSVLALVLALGAAATSGAGVLAVFLGLPRYLFVAAGWVLPWMRRELPERFSRKAVCVAQLAVLIALQAPALPAGLALALAALAAAALAWSFGVDLVWLRRRRA